MQNWTQQGKTITVLAPYTVTSGQGVQLGLLFGVASFAAASGAQLEIMTEGVVTLPKDASTFIDGAPVYWDAVGKQATATQATNKEIGVACLINPDGTSDPGGLSGDATVRLRLRQTPGARGLQIARALYSFAADGGAVGAITPAISDTIPANALVIGNVVNSPTAVTSAGSATISVGTTAGSGAATLLAATAKTSFSLDAVQAGLANTVPFKMSAAGQINLTVAVAALTAGVVEMFVFYVPASLA